MFRNVLMVVNKFKGSSKFSRKEIKDGKNDFDLKLLTIHDLHISDS